MLAKFNAELMFAGDVVAEVVANETAARTGTVPVSEAPAARAPAEAAPPPVTPPAAPRESPFAPSSATALPFARSRLAGLAGEDEAAAAALPLVPPGREPVASSGEPKEMARVDADLLDMLLNTSGEASIARARLEQQLGSFDFNLGELSRTVTRLKEQLRSLEIETEAQILHKHEDEGCAPLRVRPARAGPLFLDPAVLARARRDRQRRGQHPAAAGEPRQGHRQPAAAAGAHHHRAAERPDAHAHGAVPAPRAAPGAHRAPGRLRHRQARGADRRGRLRRAGPAGARAHAAAVRAHAAQRGRARHREARRAHRAAASPTPGASCSSCTARAPRSWCASPTMAAA